ncbi:MAG: hypothetical protein COX62_07825 [Deltaproteobacteria bacterium CG_4_10_14_0_2_um_filter_43_8]|nr:MAG: hypothetical protein COV43_02280 [Deltaproteobacteria bacterium CG11_big_fil_rev_8_21_14_0_20_42_23]PJA18885.1 MAG: hypothetical protein COX62_07825 [Deltaproteobacteria bacterium CG_4_10_14_0_2_um_filter_43_8]PJC64753.1 MAG: hypothetical protein CO021_02815 [Deltaproteobacteria bacterium CG_4_9_14_0_2_um_filter_42_21]
MKKCAMYLGGVFLFTLLTACHGGQIVRDFDVGKVAETSDGIETLATQDQIETSILPEPEVKETLECLKPKAEGPVVITPSCGCLDDLPEDADVVACVNTAGLKESTLLAQYLSMEADGEKTETRTLLEQMFNFLPPRMGIAIKYKDEYKANPDTFCLSQTSTPASTSDAYVPSGNSIGSAYGRNAYTTNGSGLTLGQNYNYPSNDTYGGESHILSEASPSTTSEPTETCSLSQAIKEIVVVAYPDESDKSSIWALDSWLSSKEGDAKPVLTAEEQTALGTVPEQASLFSRYELSTESATASFQESLFIARKSAGKILVGTAKYLNASFSKPAEVCGLHPYQQLLNGFRPSNFVLIGQVAQGSFNKFSSLFLVKEAPKESLPYFAGAMNFSGDMLYAHIKGLWDKDKPAIELMTVLNTSLLDLNKVDTALEEETAQSIGSSNQ